MIVYAVALFLVALAVLGMLGSLLSPWSLRRARRCPNCGRYRIGRGPCVCEQA